MKKSKKKKNFEKELKNILKKHEDLLKEAEKEYREDNEEDAYCTEQITNELEKTKSNVLLIKKILKVFISCKNAEKK